MRTIGMGGVGTALVDDLVVRIGKVLGALIGIGADRGVGIARALANCSGEGCVEEYLGVTDGAVAELVFEKQTASKRLTQGAALLVALMDLAKTLDKHGLLNNDFRRWLARVRRGVARGDEKAVVEFLKSSGRLLHHAGCTARYKGLPVDIPLSLMLMGDAMNWLFLLGKGDPNNDILNAVSQTLFSILTLGGKADEVYKEIAKMQRKDLEDVKRGAMRVLDLCAEFIKLHDEGIMLTND